MSRHRNLLRKPSKLTIAIVAAGIGVAAAGSSVAATSWPASAASGAATAAIYLPGAKAAPAADPVRAQVQLQTFRTALAQRAQQAALAGAERAADARQAAAREAAADRAARAAARQAAALAAQQAQPAQQAPSPAPAQPAAPAQPSGSAQQIAMAMLGSYGWSSSQFSCLDSLWARESGWNVTASNPDGAYGIPQAMTGSKMASAGPNWQTDAATQIRWGLGYIRSMYGSPCAAWAHSQATGWY